jgi:SAM-dependent methyltransferase
MGLSLFDETASSFAAGTDDQLARNRYIRGQRFVEAVLDVTPPSGYVLDYGCGPGRLARLIGQCGFRVHGVDASQGMIEEARRLDLDGAAVTFEGCAEYGDDLVANRYDVVVCSSVIEYVKDCTRLLLNFRRSLKREGALVLSYANRKSLWRTYAKWKCSGRQPHYSLQHNVWCFAECERQLLDCGFVVFGVTRFFDSPFDQHPILAPVGRLERVGTLGLVTARRVEIAPN